MRQELVLQKMADQGFISPAEKSEAVNTKLTFKSPRENFNTKAMHFALMVGTKLKEKFGEETISRSGFRVRTTIDLEWQEFAEKAVSTQVKKLAVNNVSNGAAVVLDPKTGEIKAWVGSKDWHDNDFGKVNLPLMPRQPGSAFKPIVYSAALERGLITPATVLKDSPTTYNNRGPGAIPYSPVNYDRKFRGGVTVRRALSNSLNVPSVEVMSKVGVPASLEMAHRLGITTLDDPSRFGLSLVLGAGEVKMIDLVGAYAVFANNGVKNEPTGILEIQDKQNQIIYSFEPNPQPVLNPGVAFIISSILSDTTSRQEIFGNTLDNPLGAAVKTGTTENYRDAWTVGFTPTLVVGAWVGNNDGALMDNIAGSLGAAPIWKNLLEKFSEGTPVKKFAPPSEVDTLTCRITNTSSYQEYFLKKMTPPGFCLPDSTTTLKVPTATPSASPSPTQLFQSLPFPKLTL